MKVFCGKLLLLLFCCLGAVVGGTAADDDGWDGKGGVLEWLKHLPSILRLDEFFVSVSYFGFLSLYE